MKVNELLDEGWKANAAALAAAPIILGLGANIIAPNVTINGDRYAYHAKHAVEKAKDLKHGTALVNGDRVKVIYGTIPNTAKNHGGEMVKVYAVED